MNRISDRHEELLRACFACDADIAASISAKGQERVFSAREPIILAGEASHDCWLILEGQAQELAYTPNGQYMLVHGYCPGDLFGQPLASGVDDREVAATEATTVGRFGRMEFLALMEQHQCVALTVVRQLTGRLSETARRMVQVATLSVAGRIHAELLRLSRDAQDWTIRPSPILSEFALRVQSTRETVSRTISQLEKRGIIHRDEHGLRVVAPHRLEEMIF